MELLTVVLTILADGGFVLRCRARAGNTEICLEGAEAVGFLGEETAFQGQRRERREGKLSRDGDRKRAKGGNLLCNPSMRLFS